MSAWTPGPVDPASRPAWEISQNAGRSGTGNWEAFDRSLEDIRRAAGAWERAVAGVTKPWLCWAVNDSWALVQQKLVRAMGWTPVVGWDPVNGRRPLLIPDAIAIDFNAELRLPVMWFHFPLEFVFLWTERLAFWHSDLLMRLPKLRQVVHTFDGLQDGEMAAVVSYGGRRNILRFRQHRYYELLGCTTRGASASQFRQGAGWWRCIWRHPNCPDERERRRRARYSWEHGVGIMYWKRRYGGRIHNISERWVTEGHFTEFTIPGYRKAGSKAEELANFDLRQIGRQLDIEEFVGT